MIFNLKNQSIERKIDIACRAMNFLQAGHKQLTLLEIQLIAIIATLPDKFKYAPFSLPAKRYVRNVAKDRYNWKITPINYNNKLYALSKKEVITQDIDGVMYFSPRYEKMLQEIRVAHANNKPFELTFSFPPEETKKSEGTTGGVERDEPEVRH